MKANEAGKIGFWGVTAIGVGGMVGGGIFAVLGLAVQLAKGGTPIAFFIAGLIALITSYSYAKLSVIYPSQGGTVEFLNQAFGTGIPTGGLNILLWLSYIIMLSLYAYAFGSYGASFFAPVTQPLVKHLFITGVILGLMAINVLGAAVVGEVEEWIVGFKISILLLFVLVGLWSVDWQRLQPHTWAPPERLVTGGMIIFLAYEGFELIANTARNVKDPFKTLPRAYFSSVIFVIVLYVLVSLVTVGNLAYPKIVAARDYALAESAKPFFGHLGFVLIAVAALLSTASAINATLYGSARVSYIIARDGELPRFLEKKIWQKPLEGLILTTLITLFAANFLDLSSISFIGSAGFLLIFTAVNLANARLHRSTYSKSWVSLLGALACFGALVLLVWQRFVKSPSQVYLLIVIVVGAFVTEAVYRKLTGRSLKTFYWKREQNRS